MNASIADVAARAGVSVATVSRALRGLPNVADATRKRVLEAAQQLDYVVNPHASRLAAGTNRTVGMVVATVISWYYQHVVAGIESILSQADYDVLLYNIPTPESRERFLTALPFRKRVDGLILADFALSDAEQRMLADLDTPIVSVGIASRHYPVVCIDNLAAARTATTHLLGLGHRRIGLISGDEGNAMGFTVPVDRRRGWRRALADAGIDAPRSWEAYGGFTLQGGAKAMAELLDRDLGLTAVFAESDEMAIGALTVLRERDIAVPREMSVVGFDGFDISGFLGLTTVAQPMHQLGEVAAELLLDLLRDTDRDGDLPPVVLPTRLEVRQTTGPAPPRATYETGS